MLEGVAEAAVLVTKMFSGAASDALGKRKGLALVGYGMAVLTKPLFPLAGSYAIVFAARLSIASARAFAGRHGTFSWLISCPRRVNRRPTMTRP